MKLNTKKLKRNSEIGDRLDLVPLVIIVISLFGIGIFYNLFRANIIPRIFSVFALALFAVAFIICGLLYVIGKLNRRSAKKAVFNYVDEVVNTVADEICRSENIIMYINLNIKKEGIIFNLSSGKINVSCDLTAAKRLPAASLIFIAVCTGVVSSKIENGMQGGKNYKNVVYTVVVNDSPSPAQYLVQNGTPDSNEMDRSLRSYNNYIKKYRKTKRGVTK